MATSYNPSQLDFSAAFAPKNPITGQPMSLVRPDATAPAPANPDPMQGWADLSSAIGAAGSGAKADRALQGQFTQNYDRLMLEAQQNQRANEADALKKLDQTAYINQGGSHYQPPNISLNGKSYQLSDMGMGPTPISDAQRQAAQTLEGTLQQRLAPGGSYQPQDLNSYAKPGGLEKATDIIAPIVGGVGGIDKLLGGKISGAIKGGLGKLFGAGGGASNLTRAAGATPSDLSGFAAGGDGTAAGGAGSFLASNALPIAGVAAGAYGLAKNHSRLADVGSGALAGGSTGWMFGGPVGAGIGAGIGAGAGLLRHAVGGPDAVEKDARAAGGDFINQLTAGTTPAEQAEAQKAGWSDPNQALALISMRDKLQASGKDPNQASMLMQQLLDAESKSKNPQAVAAATSNIQHALGLA